jgi:hypothetical protein
MTTSTEAAKGLKGLVGQRVTRDAKFMGTNVKISKLNLDEVMQIQRLAKEMEANKDNASDDAGMDLLKMVIRQSAEGATDLSDEDFATFPMDELSKLADDIMKFSGMGTKDTK